MARALQRQHDGLILRIPDERPSCCQTRRRVGHLFAVAFLANQTLCFLLFTTEAVSGEHRCFDCPNHLQFLGASIIFVPSDLLMDDWYEEDGQSDGLASAEARSLRARFYNIGIAYLITPIDSFPHTLFMISARSGCSQRFCPGGFSAAVYAHGNFPFSCVCSKRLLFGNLRTGIRSACEHFKGRHCTGLSSEISIHRCCVSRI